MTNLNDWNTMLQKEIDMQEISEFFTRMITSYGIFGVMVALFLIGKAKKLAKHILFLILVIGVGALFYGGYLTLNFPG